MKFSIQIPKPREELLQEFRPLPKSEARESKKLWLDKNECIDPEYIELLKTILAKISPCAFYAYPDCFALYEKLANYLQIETEELIIAAGSDGVIRAVYETFIKPGDVIVYPEPTFWMYSLYAKIYGAKAKIIDYEASQNGPCLAKEKLLQAIKTEKPRLVCLPNPGSPTGTIFSLAELQEIIEAAALVKTVIIIDEAYYPFYSQTVLSWINKYTHLVITRSFSKAWGLAGVRVGYGVAGKELMRELYKVRPRYEIGSLSAAFIENALDYAQEMKQSVARLNNGKKFFVEEMRKLGFQALDTYGNFLLVKFEEQAEKVHYALKNRVYYQQDFNHPALKGYSRFTTTTKELFLPIVEEISKIVKFHNQCVSTQTTEALE